MRLDSKPASSAAWPSVADFAQRLLDVVFAPELLDRHERVLAAGPAGAGRNFLAQALGISAVRYTWQLSRPRSSCDCHQKSSDIHYTSQIVQDKIQRREVPPTEQPNQQAPARRILATSTGRSANQGVASSAARKHHGSGHGRRVNKPERWRQSYPENGGQRSVNMGIPAVLNTVATRKGGIDTRIKEAGSQHSPAVENNGDD